MSTDTTGIPDGEPGMNAIDGVWDALDRLARRVDASRSIAESGEGEAEAEGDADGS
jgi:hypothetical protein